MGDNKFEIKGFLLSASADVQIGAPDLPITVKYGEFTATGAVTEILRLNLVAALKRIEQLEERLARLESEHGPA